MTQAQKILKDLKEYGNQYIEIGTYKTVKNSNTIKAVLATGEAKIVDKKWNRAGTGYEWVELELVKK